MNLLSLIIDRLNQRVATHNLFDQIYGLSELNQNGNEKAWVNYIGEGQAQVVSDYDGANGTLFWAKRGRVTIAKTDQYSSISCRQLYVTSIPLSAYAIVRKSSLPCDLADSSDFVANELFKYVSGKDVDFRLATGLIQYEVVPSSYGDEVKALSKNYEWACVTVDFNIDIVTDSNDGCYAPCDNVPLPPYTPPVDTCCDIAIYDEGMLLTAAVSQINFEGEGVTATVDGTSVTVTITGGGGTYTVNNGLTENPVGNFQLGGSLIQNTVITGNTFGISINSNTGYPVDALYVSNGGSGQAIFGQHFSGGTAVAGLSYSGVGVSGGTQNGTGVFAYSNAGAGLPLRVGNDQSSTNTVIESINSQRSTIGVAGNGIGQSMVFEIETTSNIYKANSIISKWSDATEATRTSQFEIEGVDNAVLSRIFALTGPGQLILDKYTTATSFAGVSGASVGVLNVDLAGNVFVAAGGGSSPLTTKGDLYTFSTINARLAIGADGTILIADSTQATGNKWVALSSEATIAVSGAITLSNAAVIAKVLTGYVSGAGTISATDSILQAIQKLNGNIAAGSSNSDYNNNFLLMGG